MREIEKMPEAVGMLVAFEPGNRHIRVFGYLGGIKRLLCTYSRGKGADTRGRGTTNLYVNLRRELRRLREMFEQREASAAA